MRVLNCQISDPAHVCSDGCVAQVPSNLNSSQRPSRPAKSVRQIIIPENILAFLEQVFAKPAEQRTDEHILVVAKLAFTKDELRVLGAETKAIIRWTSTETREEIVQITAEQLIKSRFGKFDPKRGPLREYCKGAVRNQSRRWLTKNAKNILQETSGVSIDDVADQARNPEEHLAYAESEQAELEAKTECFRMLSPNEQTVLRSRILNVPYAEVALQLKMNEARVRQMKRRAKEKLANCVGKKMRISDDSAAD